MAGAYCKFCDNRCFVERVIPSGPQMGWTGHLATCKAGKEYDRTQTGGFDSSTAINPVTHPRQASLVRRVATLRRRQKLASEMLQGQPGSYNETAIVADLAEAAFELWDFMSDGRGMFGVCGTRLHQQSVYLGSMYLTVCTKEPGHVDRGEREHEDETLGGAPGARWVNPTREEHDAMYGLEPQAGYPPGYKNPDERYAEQAEKGDR
jgi:hypothetical protein